MTVAQQDAATAPPVRTMASAREQLNREWPGRSAPASAWQIYYQRAVTLYEHVAKVDNNHHYEALYLASEARESLRTLCEQAAG